MSMPTSTLVTSKGHKLLLKCMWKCIFLLVYLWVAVELLLPIPSAYEPNVEPVAWYAFTGQLVQHDHPTLLEGLRALLVVQVT